MEKLIDLLRQAYVLENAQKPTLLMLGKSITGKSTITRSQYLKSLHFIRKHNLNVDDWAELRSLVKEPLAVLDPISSQSWFTSTALHCSKRYWEQIGSLLKSFHGCQCAICGVTKSEDEIDIQELWHFEDTIKVQTLECYYPICINCQDYSFMPSAEDGDEIESFTNFFKTINGWSKEESLDHIHKAISLKMQRDQSDWIVDVEHLVTELSIHPNNVRENVFDDEQKQSILHCLKSIQDDAREDYNLNVEIDCRFSIF